MKNATPRQVSIIASVIISVLILFACLGIKWYDPDGFKDYLILLIPILVFISCYFIFSFILQKFIYRKIKLIYKIIYDLKSPNKSKVGAAQMNSNVIQDAELEVLQWAKAKKQETDQLKKMEQYRKEFLGNVSHELKTPIFNIQGFIETLIDGGIKDEAVNMDYLHKAANNIDRLSAIVEDLELISMIESGALDLTLEDFNICELSGEIFDSLEKQANAANIQLGFKEGCSDGFIVNSDKERIRQVLINLIINSIKYGKEGGETLIGCYDMDEHILIEVSDNGIGIEKKHLPRLFERFYRVGTNRSREQGGTGLGLSIVKHIMEAHNQTINVRSTVGVGSTFGFTLKKA